jgi:hypothetical protein
MLLYMPIPGEGCGMAVHQFDHRWATYGVKGEWGMANGERRMANGDDADRSSHTADSRDVTDEEKGNPRFTVTPRYWVRADEVEQRLKDKGWTRGWLMGWRDICRATDYRTLIANVIPRIAVGDKFLLMMPDCSPSQAAALLGCLNSLTCDFVTRQKVGGTSLKYFTMKQIAVLPPSHYTETDLAFIVPRVLELTFTAWDLLPWAEDLVSDLPIAIHNSPLTTRGDSPLTPYPFNPTRRAILRAELDAWYARAYGLTRDELRYILDPADLMGEDYPSETFRVLKNKEQKEFGEYRTQRLVLAAWDQLETGTLR